MSISPVHQHTMIWFTHVPWTVMAFVNLYHICSRNSSSSCCNVQMGLYYYCVLFQSWGLCHIVHSCHCKCCYHVHSYILVLLMPFESPDHWKRGCIHKNQGGRGVYWFIMCGHVSPVPVGLCCSWGVVTLSCWVCGGGGNYRGIGSAA